MKSSMEKRMFRAAAVLLCGAGLAIGPAMAQQDQAPPPPDGQMQGPPPGGQRGHGANPDKRAEMMQSQLNLSADQTSQVRSILEDEQSKTEALRSNTSLAKKDRRQQMKTIHEDGEAKIQALLTPDQKTKYEAMQASERERMQQRRQGGAGAPGADDGSAPPPPPPSAPQQ